MNQRRGILKEKTFAFSLKIIAYCKYLIGEHKEYILSRQLLKSGTAIGALVSEAQYAESKADFIHKISIALKECNETIYWLELMSASDFILRSEDAELIKLCKEISYMLIATLNRSKKNLSIQKGKREI